MNVSVVGAGRVGTAIAVLLDRGGHDIRAVSGREATRARARRFLPGVPVLDEVEAAGASELVLVAVPDDAIAETVARLADAGALREGQWVAHVSGVTGLDALEPARAAGARRLATHPLQTFPDVESAIERIPGCAVAVTADDEGGHELGARIARDCGAIPFRLPDERRALYHAAAVFASNYLVATSSVAARLLREAGLEDPLAAMSSLQRATLDNVDRLGPGAALTGPAVRGDAATVDRHLAALRDAAPELVPAYVELCVIALRLGSEAGRLPEERRAAVEEVLSRWM